MYDENMKIILTSDIHGNHEIIEKIVNMHPTADLFLDAGDSEMPPLLLRPFISVKGNCDYHPDLLNNLTLSTPYGKLYIQHRPTIPYSVLQNEEIMIIINGHTHIPAIQKIKNVYFLNPGSVSYPRGGNVGTYMELDITIDGVKVQVKELI